MTPADEPVYGAAPERTALAWQRSGLGVVVGCFLVFAPLQFGSGSSRSRWRRSAWGWWSPCCRLAFRGPTFLRGDPADSWPLLAALTTAVVALAVLGAVVAVVALR